MRFKDIYYHKEISLPIHFDCCYINENNELEFQIPMKYIPMLVDEGALILMYKEKLFKTYKEAIDYYDKNPLNEAAEEKYISKTVTFPDPETGEERHFEVAKGNVKIGGDTIIINMSTATECMSAIIGLCKLAADGYCYALRPEKRFRDMPTGAKAKNIRHEKQWSCLTPFAIAKGLDEIAKRLKKIKYVRVNEAGEFRNLPADPDLLAKVPQEMKNKIGAIDDVKKLQQVGEELKKLGSDLILYTYTHRTDLNIGDLGSNICINGSQFMLDNAFIAVPYEEFLDIMNAIDDGTIKGKEYFGAKVINPRHCMGDCRKCNYCKKKENKHIFLPIHGSGTKFNNRIDEIIGFVTSNPEFDNIIASTQTDEEKAEALYKILQADPALSHEFTNLIPIRADRLDIFKKLVSGKINVDAFIKDLETYSKMYIEDPEAAAKDGIAKSIDSLTGKFENEINRAISMGQKASIKKWTNLKKALEKVVNAARSGKKIRPSKSLAQRWASIKRELGD
ncbi:MAG: hypothetical protein QXG00_07220 [Candidatus Woesearchaeota archaeon]